MGIYLRKYIKVGPIRFNLSKSGVGVSAGVRGARIGTGPRGNHIHMGRHGIYYRKTLPSGSSHEKSGGARPVEVDVGGRASDETDFKKIESRDVSGMVDSSSSELLDELNTKGQLTAFLPIVLILGAGLIISMAFFQVPLWLMGFTSVSAIILAFFAGRRDTLRKTSVLFYDFDRTMERAYEKFYNLGVQAGHCGGVWHIVEEGAVRDRKYHAGAGHLVKRNTTFFKMIEPPNLKTNIAVLAIRLGGRVLYFFPDRVLLQDGRRFGGVGYNNLKIEVSASRFIEELRVPHDAEIVDRTWRYVNKSGGPDRRFKDNVELPVCLYDEIELSSTTGLRERIQLSKHGLGEDLSMGIMEMGARLATETKGVPPEQEVERPENAPAEATRAQEVSWARRNFAWLVFGCMFLVVLVSGAVYMGGAYLKLRQTSQPEAVSPNERFRPAEARAARVDSAQKEIEELLTDWRLAWEREDVESFMKAYDRAFRSGEHDIQAWRRKKMSAFRKSEDIRVGLEDLRVEVEGSVATVSFVQNYRSSAISDRGQKTLKLRKSQNGWKITSESWRELQ